MSKKEHECGRDGIAEAIEFMDDVDIVVNVEGDEPFTEVAWLQKLIAVFEKDSQKEIDLASLMVHIEDWDEISNPNTVKVITDSNQFALYFSKYASLKISNSGYDSDDEDTCLGSPIYSPILK